MWRKISIIYCSFNVIPTLNLTQLHVVQHLVLNHYDPSEPKFTNVHILLENVGLFVLLGTPKRTSKSCRRQHHYLEVREPCHRKETIFKVLFTPTTSCLRALVRIRHVFNSLIFSSLTIFDNFHAIGNNSCIPSLFPAVLRT